MFFFFSSRRRHTRWTGDWSSDVCSSDLEPDQLGELGGPAESDQLGELGGPGEQGWPAEEARPGSEVSGEPTPAEGPPDRPYRRGVGFFRGGPRAPPPPLPPPPPAPPGDPPRGEKPPPLHPSSRRSRPRRTPGRAPRRFPCRVRPRSEAACPVPARWPGAASHSRLPVPGLK